MTAAAPDPETGREKTVEADEDRWVPLTKFWAFHRFTLQELSIGEINQATGFLENNKITHITWFFVRVMYGFVSFFPGGEEGE